MLKNDFVHEENTSMTTQDAVTRGVEIPNAPQVRLQTLDLARNVAIAPDGKRYVVGTFDDTRLGNGYVTAIYPQQNGYLTLIRLTVCQFSSATPQEAIERHRATVQAIQQGKLSELVQKANA